MASTVPYAAPYARTVPRVRSALRLRPDVARFLQVSLVVVVSYVVIQLALAAVASAIIHDLSRLEQTIAFTQRERDALMMRVQECRTPLWLETRARERGFVPLTNVEFGR